MYNARAQLLLCLLNLLCSDFLVVVFVVVFLKLLNRAQMTSKCGKKIKWHTKLGK